MNANHLDLTKGISLDPQQYEPLKESLFRYLPNELFMYICQWVFPSAVYTCKLHYHIWKQDVAFLEEKKQRQRIEAIATDQGLYGLLAIQFPRWSIHHPAIDQTFRHHMIVAVQNYCISSYGKQKFPKEKYKHLIINGFDHSDFLRRKKLKQLTAEEEQTDYRLLFQAQAQDFPMTKQGISMLCQTFEACDVLALDFHTTVASSSEGSQVQTSLNDDIIDAFISHLPNKRLKHLSIQGTFSKRKVIELIGNINKILSKTLYGLETYCERLHHHQSTDGVIFFTECPPTVRIASYGQDLPKVGFFDR